MGISEAEQWKIEAEGLQEENQMLLEALEATVKPLERLGDFIGNVDKGGASGLGPFDRCAILLRVRDAIEKARGRG
jgi:hypothetical protein